MLLKSKQERDADTPAYLLKKYSTFSQGQPLPDSHYKCKLARIVCLLFPDQYFVQIVNCDTVHESAQTMA